MIVSLCIYFFFKQNMFEELGWLEWVSIAAVIIVIYVLYEVREFKKMDKELVEHAKNPPVSTTVNPEKLGI